MASKHLDELTAFLRPAGGGVYVVSTGVAEQQALQQALYGAQRPDDIEAAWRRALGRLHQARVVVLGVPSDAGAGFDGAVLGGIADGSHGGACLLDVVDEAGVLAVAQG